MYRVEDPVFAMEESFFLDGGSRLDDVDLRSLASVSEMRSVARQHPDVPDVGRYPSGYGARFRAQIDQLSWYGAQLSKQHGRDKVPTHARRC